MSNHSIVETGVDKHTGKYWHECTKCKKSDWIASYGTMNQLNFYDKPCIPLPTKKLSSMASGDWRHWK